MDGSPRRRLSIRSDGDSGGRERCISVTVVLGLTCHFVALGDIVTVPGLAGGALGALVVIASVFKDASSA